MPRPARYFAGGTDAVMLPHIHPPPKKKTIYERFRDAIARGVLRPGERLPSARSLASQLATSRGTADPGQNVTDMARL